MTGEMDKLSETKVGASKSTLKRLRLLDAEDSWRQRNEVLASFLQNYFKGRGDPITILEAGCGKKWRLDLGDIRFQLTGVDRDRNALEIRQANEGDLARAIVGDLRTVDLGREQFDVAHCFNVLEHVRDAQHVVDRFFGWLKPGGLLVLVFPDRDTVFGFLTRITPHFLHVAFHRYAWRTPNAGKPGYGPYPTYYDRIVSRRGIREYCCRHGYNVCLEYGRPYSLGNLPGWLALTYAGLAELISALSFGRLSTDRGGLVYVIQKTNQRCRHPGGRSHTNAPIKAPGRIEMGDDLAKFRCGDAYFGRR